MKTKITEAHRSSNYYTNLALEAGIPAVLYTADPSKTLAGFVVRYERGGPDGGVSDPLSYEYESGGLVLLINHSLSGTIFADLAQAIEALAKSVSFQYWNNYLWNHMYGRYLVTPVYHN